MKLKHESRSLNRGALYRRRFQDEMLRRENEAIRLKLELKMLSWYQDGMQASRAAARRTLEASSRTT